MDGCYYSDFFIYYLDLFEDYQQTERHLITEIDDLNVQKISSPFYIIKKNFF